MAKKKLKGIEGWLILLVVILVLSLFKNLISLVPYVTTDFTKYPLFSLLILIVGIGHPLLMGYGISLLVRERNNAVFVIRSALIIILVATIISLFFIGGSMTEQEINVTAGKLVLGCVIWLFYLNMSKRVKNTFPLKKRFHTRYDVALVVWSSIAHLMWLLLGFAV